MYFVPLSTVLVLRVYSDFLFKSKYEMNNLTTNCPLLTSGYNILTANRHFEVNTHTGMLSHTMYTQRCKVEYQVISGKLFCAINYGCTHLHISYGQCF